MFSALRERRPLHAGPLGRRLVAQVGVEPTASLVLSESGRPIAYRATLRHRVVKDQVPGVGVEPTRTGSKPVSLPLADPGACLAAARRAARFLEPRLNAHRRKERESNPQGLRSTVFETAAITSWLALPFCSLDGWIRTSDLRLPKPADSTKLSHIQMRGEGRERRGEA